MLVHLKDYEEKYLRIQLDLKKAAIFQKKGAGTDVHEGLLKHGNGNES